MILIADSGSTKTDWLTIPGDQIADIFFQTKGYNPNVISDDIMRQDLLDNDSILGIQYEVTQLYFYGAGCSTADNISRMEQLLKTIFIHAKVQVKSDIDGAALACCGNEQGIICILGTGSNSCFYDGKTILGNGFSLGYILGDEGSGSHFGKRLLRDYFYGLMPEDLSIKFKNAYNITRDSVLQRIYKSPFPNSYIASFLPFMYEQREHPYCQYFISYGLEEFLKIYVWRFEQYQKVPVHFIGSVGYCFSDILQDICAQSQITVGKIIQNPIHELWKYHNA